MSTSNHSATFSVHLFVMFSIKLSMNQHTIIFIILPLKPTRAPKSDHLSPMADNLYTIAATSNRSEQKFKSSWSVLFPDQEKSEAYNFLGKDQRRSCLRVVGKKFSQQDLEKKILPNFHNSSQLATRSFHFCLAFSITFRPQSTIILCLSSSIAF